MFTAVLKEEVTDLTTSSLEEQALITALIAQSGVGECVLKLWKVGNTGINMVPVLELFLSRCVLHVF